MKKCIVILFILSASILFAQKGTYFRFEGGASLPLQDLSSQKWDTSSQTGGFALTGYNYGIDISWFLQYNMGVSFTYTKNRHLMDDAAIYLKAFEEGIDSQLTVESNPWLLNYFLLGFNYQFYTGERIKLEAKLDIGRLSTFCPKVKLRVIDVNGIIANYEREAVHDAAFAFGGGLGVKYKISETLHLTLFANYLFSSTEFLYKENSIKVKNNLGVLNGTLGLAYKF